MNTVQEITSAQNPRIKNVVRLRTRKARDAARTMIIEGELELERAIAAGVTLSELYYCSDDTQGEHADWLVQTCIDMGVSLYKCDRKAFSKIAYGNHETGVLALAAYFETPVSSLSLADDALVIVLEAVEKPGNLGAVLRSADGAGADAVILCDPSTDLFNPNTIRASRGALFTVPVVTGTSEEVISFLKRSNINIYATMPDARTPYTSVNLTSGVALAMGTEHDGLTRIWEDAADSCITIPMRGKADSLNVAVTATIMMYEALRQRSTVGSI